LLNVEEVSPGCLKKFYAHRFMVFTIRDDDSARFFQGIHGRLVAKDEYHDIGLRVIPDLHSSSQ